MGKSGYAQRDLIKFNFANLDLKGLDFFGNSPPAVFVGRFGYPKVNVGVLSPTQKEESSYLMDNPKEWAKQGLKDQDILKLRAQLVNARFQSSVKNFDSRLLDLSQEVGMAHKPVDMEISLKNKPKNLLKMENVAKPLSNNANVKNIKLTENPKIKTVVDKTVSDGDMKSVEGLYKLYNKGMDENFLSKILSIGLLGKQKNRRLVPTRWSITATDDLITKNLLTQVRQNSQINNYFVFESTYIGNHFVILLEPGNWEFENFEAWAPGSNWAQGQSVSIIEEYEPFQGRKKYADKQAGGYYAARLGIIEFLSKIKKQARVISFREISEEYVLPLGVWVVRETVRNAFKSKASMFSSRDEAITYIKTKLKIPFQAYINQSELLKQKKLDYFFN